MTAFDPNDELETKEQADAYVTWCAENFMRLCDGQTYTYRTAIRAAAWLHVIATAQLHLDDEVIDHRDALLKQLTVHTRLARLIERQKVKLPVERMMIVRSTFDCWQPVGRYADNLLHAAKCAVTALILIDLHPLIDLWDLSAPDVWALLDSGRLALARINDAEDEAGWTLEFDDYAVGPNDDVIAKMTWQKVNNLVRNAGLDAPQSAN